MTAFTLRDTLLYLSESLGLPPPDEDALNADEIELVLDHASLFLLQSKGTLKMTTVMGKLKAPLSEAQLKELATGNFLGINTGGCTLTLQDHTLELCATLPLTCSPKTNKEWFERLIYVSGEWQKKLLYWKVFAPSNPSMEQEKPMQPSLTNLRWRV